ARAGVAAVDAAVRAGGGGPDFGGGVGEGRMAKGYLVANITVTDVDRFEQYRRAVSAVIERYGGRYLVRGGAVEKAENAEGYDRLVVLEFGSIEAARTFYASPEYA